jgi:beta-lactamase superfamily II metal-dependent hydrolase
MKKPLYLWFFVLILAVTNIAIFYSLYLDNSSSMLKVDFLDIGQGDSVYIQAPNGNQMLVDGGKPGSVLARLGEVMPLSDKSIDVVMGSHPDADHVGGLNDVLDSYHVGTVIEPGSVTDTKTWTTLEDKIKEKSIPRILAQKGMKIILDKKHGVYVDILFPDQDVSGWETNASSIVARVVYGHESFLLTGDSPIAIEQYLVGMQKYNLKSTVLKLGHHGSRTSSSQIYLETVAPEYAVISAGLNNSYGHPHKEVTDLLAFLHIPSLSTIEKGTIKFETNGEKLEVK